MGRFGSTKTKKQFLSDLGLDTSPEVQKEGKAHFDKLRALDPNPVQSAKSSYGEVECFCNEVLYTTISITTNVDPGPPITSSYNTFIRQGYGSGCEKEKLPNWYPYVEITTTPNPTGDDIIIEITEGNSCGKCKSIDPPDETPFGSDADPCEFVYGKWIESFTKICTGTATGEIITIPPECGVIFEIVNGVKYAQKCVLSCNPSTNVCYWRKLIPGLITPTKPGFIDRPVTRWCRGNNQPTWEATLIMNVHKMLEEIEGSIKLKGCEALRASPACQ
jgi:hypothetical protein